MGAIGMGSFRGVNFYVKGADSGIGRRTVIHEFPGSDVGAGEDLGQRVRRYTLECYVLGGGYMAPPPAQGGGYMVPPPAQGGYMGSPATGGFSQ